METTSNRRRVCYDLHRGEGAGNAIAFVAGAFQDRGSWKRFLPAFLPLGDVLAIDLPGTGESDPLPPEAGVDVLAEALRDVLDAAGLPKVRLVAASYGTPTAYRFAQRWPERTESLVLAGTVAALTRDMRIRTERSIELIADGRLEAFVDHAVDSLMNGDAAADVENAPTVERVFRRCLVRMTDDDRARYVANSRRLLDHPAIDLGRPPRVPALVFTGVHDRFTPPDEGARVAAAIPGARFETLPGADHLFHLERFDAMVGLLRRFLDEAVPAGRRVA